MFSFSLPSGLTTWCAPLPWWYSSPTIFYTKNPIVLTTFTVVVGRLTNNTPSVVTPNEIVSLPSGLATWRVPLPWWYSSPTIFYTKNPIVLTTFTHPRQMMRSSILTFLWRVLFFFFRHHGLAPVAIKMPPLRGWNTGSPNRIIVDRLCWLHIILEEAVAENAAMEKQTHL